MIKNVIYNIIFAKKIKRKSKRKLKKIKRKTIELNSKIFRNKILNKNTLNTMCIFEHSLVLQIINPKLKNIFLAEENRATVKYLSAEVEHSIQ